MMMRLNKTLATGLMVIGMGVMSLPSYAQGAPGDGVREKPALSAEKIAKFEKEKARRDAALHDKLKITATQEDAWKAYLQSTKFAHKPGEHRLSKEERAKLTTPERLERQLAWMKQGEARLVERIAATKALYAVLTTEQQQAFDAHSAREHKEHGKKFRHGGGQKDGSTK
jgi:protein CpxP